MFTQTELFNQSTNFYEEFKSKFIVSWHKGGDDWANFVAANKLSLRQINEYANHFKLLHKNSLCENDFGS